MSSLMRKQNNPKLVFDSCATLHAKNTAIHPAFATPPSSLLMADAVATPMYRSVLFLGKEGQRSSATLWRNNYYSVTNKM